MLLNKKGRKREIRKKGRLFVFLCIGLMACLLNAIFLHHTFTLDNDDGVIVNIHNISINSTKNRQLQRDTVLGIHDTNNNNNNTSLEQDMRGKERLLDILKDAGYLAISRDALQKLPTWEQVVELYGNEPKIVGLETCDTFRNTVDPRKAFPAPAGPFNSGTNLLSGLLWRNCAFPQLRRKLDHYGKRWQVNYGKHQPPRTRAYHQLWKSINNTIQLPVVAVRDPYSWMQSMCRHGYTAHWFHTTKHCPNFIPSDIDYTMLESLQHEDDNITPPQLDDADYVNDDDPQANFTNSTRIIPVSVEYNSLTTHHASLAEMWNDWYGEYAQADFPRIFVRMEDLVFHTSNVTEQICQCAGGRLSTKRKFQYVRNSAKEDELHEFQYETTMLDAMIRYGSATNQDRLKGMTQEDAAYAQSVLRPDLMDMFGYSYPNEKQEEEVPSTWSWRWWR